MEIEEICPIILKGGVVAIPTDTVYGLAADATSPEAVNRLFEAKGRELTKEVSVFVGEKETVEEFCTLSPLAREFVESLLPGPYTLVLPVKGREIPLAESLYPGGTLGIRLILHPVVERVLEEVGTPLTATSANLSGEPPARTPREISPLLLTRIDGVLHGGRTPGGASTVISFTGPNPVVLRRGVGIERFRRWYEEQSPEASRA